MMTCDEMIAVIQFHKDGGEVEVFKDKSWNKIVGDPSWDFRTYMYRPHIKPTPKQMFVLETWLIQDDIRGCIGLRTLEVEKGFIDKIVEAYAYTEKVKLLSTREVEID